jgi:hypothetical protein
MARNNLNRYVLTWLLLVSLNAVVHQSDAQSEWGGPEQAKARATKGKALFEEKCRTEAGEKIYRTVPDIEGVLLLRIRPQAGDREWANLMWPGAAFARESTQDDYISTFLGYEYAPGDGLTGKTGVITPQKRGYIASDPRPGGLPGYRFVDVIDEKDAQRYRYVLVRKPRPESKIGWVDTLLQRTAAASPPPIYGVTFEDHVIAEHRKLGVASSTVKVIDLRTKEVIGELTRYAWSPAGPSRANPSPWLTAYRCPDHAVGTETATRKFVDQILIPRREK